MPKEQRGGICPPPGFCEPIEHRPEPCHPELCSGGCGRVLVVGIEQDKGACVYCLAAAHARTSKI